ncbi:MAG: hypothetical protein HKM95_01000, partial [Inquilinus sp.]|nr:hypothetical protein [Inquilinus sp.]
RKGAPTGTYSYQGSVALKALELLGREFGMFGGRGAPAPDATAAMSDAGLEERAVRLARELGLGGGGA